MRIRSIAANHAHPCLGMATAAMLAVTLVASNGVHAQEWAVADAQAGAAAVVASVQRIDPTSVDLNTATQKGMRYPEDATGQPVTDTLAVRRRHGRPGNKLRDRRRPFAESRTVGHF